MKVGFLHGALHMGEVVEADGVGDLGFGAFAEEEKLICSFYAVTGDVLGGGASAHRGEAAEKGGAGEIDSVCEKFGGQLLLKMLMYVLESVEYFGGVFALLLAAMLLGAFCQKVGEIVYDLPGEVRPKRQFALAAKWTVVLDQTNLAHHLVKLSGAKPQKHPFSLTLAEKGLDLHKSEKA